MRKLFIVFTFLAVGFCAQAEEQKKVTVDLTVTSRGFEPKTVDVKPGSDVVLVVTRTTDATCAKEIQVPSRNIKTVELPLNKPVRVALGKLEKGEIRFGCGMSMMESGKIIVK